MIKVKETWVGEIPTPDIEPDMELVGYLRRWYTSKEEVKPWLHPSFSFYWLPDRYGGLMLHNLQSGDEKRLHNHPWGFTTVVLAGGYTEKMMVMDENSNEERWTGEVVDRTLKAGDIAFNAPNHLHYIDSVEPDTWSIIALMQRVRPAWGFLMEDNTIKPWRDYVRDKNKAGDYHYAARFSPRMAGRKEIRE